MIPAPSGVDSFGRFVSFVPRTGHLPDVLRPRPGNRLWTVSNAKCFGLAGENAKAQFPFCFLSASWDQSPLGGRHRTGCNPRSICASFASFISGMIKET